MMEVNRRKGAGVNVVAGSVWESRMKMDEVKGGFKVFNGEDLDNVASSVWESRMKMDDEKGGIKVFNGETEEKVLNGSVWESSRMKMDDEKGGVKVFNGEESVPENGFKGNGESLSSGGGGGGRERRKTWKCEPVEVIGRSSILLKNLRSDNDDDDEESLCEEFYDSVVGIEKSPIKVIRSSTRRSDEEVNLNRSVVDGIGKNPIQKKKSRSRSVKSSDETSKELSKLRSGRDSINGDDKEEVVVKKEIDVRSSHKKSSSVKEVNKVHEEKHRNFSVLKEKLNQIHKSTVPMSSIAKNQHHPLVKPSSDDSDLRMPLPEEFKSCCWGTQDIVDIIMWRDMEESALVFGIGVLVILLSYFTEDLNFSLVSIGSYICLIYVTAVCLYRAILCRESIDLNDSTHVVGEEDAISLVKVVLPYLNSFLLKLRLLFAGDPTTTIKFAALLFVLARYGGSITLWRMAKLGFFAVFTLPKAYSWYANQAQLNKDGNNNLF